MYVFKMGHVNYATYTVWSMTNPKFHHCFSAAKVVTTMQRVSGLIDSIFFGGVPIKHVHCLSIISFKCQPRTTAYCHIVVGE